VHSGSPERFALVTALLLTRHIRRTYRRAERLIDQEADALTRARAALDSASALDREQARILEMVATVLKHDRFRISST
jgi:hypothetical protein